MENFKVFPNKKLNLAWNELYTVKVIGVIEYIFGGEIPIVFQQPSDKVTAIKLIKGDVWPFEIPKKIRKEFSTEHEWDAYCHLVYYVYRMWRINGKW